MAALGACLSILLGYDLWKRVFQGDPNVPGKVVKLDGQPVTVVGVLPPEAAFPPRAEAWTPLAADPNDGNAYYLAGVGRLRKGVSAAQAKADLTRVHKGMIQGVKAASNEFTFPLVAPLRDRFLGDFKMAVRTLLGAVGVVLLMACVNIAGLMMVRGEARSREIAIRAAVGASGPRIVRQLLAESLLLAGLGGALGVLLGKVFLRALISLMPEDLPRWVRFDWDWRFALFAIAVTGAAALLFGLAPALQAAAVDGRGCLQAASRSTLSRGKRGALGALVVCEIALALMLLVCSGLLIQTFRKVLHVDPGFRPENVLSWWLDLPSSRYPKPEAQFAFYRELVGRLSALPGVTAVSAVSKVPLGGHDGTFFVVEGAPPPGPKDQNPVVLELVVFPGYLKAMGIALAAGRGLTEQDEAPGAANVALVSESFAKRFWPGADPLGKRFRANNGKFAEKDWFRVVGVTRDVRHYGLDEEARPTVFKPFPTRPRSGMALVLRSSAEVGGLAPAARQAIRRMDPELAMSDVKTMTERLDASLAPRRAAAWLFGAFAGVAIALAVAGIYGVVSFAVGQRRREIGIRMALGARPRQVMLGVLGGGMALVAMGVAAGLAASLAVAGLLKSLLFGVSGHDAATYGIAVTLVVCVGALANWFPARRAATVDPNSVLRFE